MKAMSIHTIGTFIMFAVQIVLQKREVTVISTVTLTVKARKQVQWQLAQPWDKRENSLKDKTFKESLAETARFELAGDCSLTDFESAPL